MKTKGLKKALAAGLSVALVAGLAVAGTVSYYEAVSNPVTNNFNGGNVDVDLKETTGDSYNIIPGTSQEKNPKVTVDNSVDAYVYVVVTDNTNGVVDYTIAEGWKELTIGEGDNAVTVDGVYYRIVNASDDEQEFDVLTDNKVTYPTWVDTEDIPENAALTFQAYAIQTIKADPAEGETNYILFTPVEAYYQVVCGNSNVAVVDNGADLNDALENGSVIVLTDDVAGELDDDSTFVDINAETTIDLNDNTLTTDYLNVYDDVTIQNGTLVATPYTLYVEGNGKTVTLKDVELVAADAETGIGLSSGSENVTYVLENVETSADIYPDTANLIINSGTYSGNVNKPAEINGGTFNGDIFVEQTEINDGEIKGTITTGGANFTLTIHGGSFNKASLIDARTAGAGEVVINGGTFAITNLLNSEIRETLGKVTISGGTFTNNLEINTTYMNAINISGGDFKAVSLTGTAYSPITISGGTFGTFSASDGAKAKLTITGGTFGSDPTSYLATGYAATKNGDGTWTVAEGN